MDNLNNKKAYSVVKLMKGETLKTIATFLNDNGFKTSTGKEFTPMAVSNLKKLYKK